MMKAQALRDKSKDQLVDMIISLKKERLSMRMQRSSGVDVKLHRLKEIRRTIAKAMTVLHENKGEDK